MSRLSRAKKREQKRAEGSPAPMRAPIDVHVRAVVPGQGDGAGLYGPGGSGPLGSGPGGSEEGARGSGAYEEGARGSGAYEEGARGSGAYEEGAYGEGASIGGVPVVAVPGEEIQHTVLTHLQRIAVATGHPVLATVHDERIGYVVPLRVDVDGSSSLTADPVRTAPPAERQPSQPSQPSQPLWDTATHVLRPLPDPAQDPSPTHRLRALPERGQDVRPGTVQSPRGEFGPPPIMDARPDQTDAPRTDRTPNAATQGLSDLAPGRFPEAASQGYPESASQGFPEAVAEGFPEAAGQEFPDSAPQKLPDFAPQQMSGSARQQSSDSAPQQFPESAPQQFPESAGREFPESASQQFPEPAGHQFPEPAGQQLPESEPQRLLDSTPQQLPDFAPRRIPGSAPDQAPAVGDGAQPPQGPPAPGRDARTGGPVGNPYPAEGRLPRTEPTPVLDLAATPDPEPKPTPPPSFDAVAEAILGDAPPPDPTTDATTDASPFAEPTTRIGEAVKTGQIDTAAELAEHTLAQASDMLGPDHPEVLRLRELAAYIAYLAGEPAHAFALSLEAARAHHRTQDADAAYGNVQSAFTAWRAVRDPEQGLELGRDLITLWTELTAEDGPAADDIEQLESARARMDRLAARAAKSTEPPLT